MSAKLQQNIVKNVPKGTISVAHYYVYSVTVVPTFLK